MPTHKRSIAVLGVSLLALGGLTACSSDDTAGGTASPATECALTVTDPWVKAQDEDMTAAFGVIENATDAEITITSASSPSAGKMEVHEVVDQDGAMVMRPKEGGLVVPAGSSAELKPGADHLMLMDLPAPIKAGDEVEITAVCDSGGSVTWISVAKPFEGGAEPYVPMEEGSMEASPSGS
ncbi:MAG: copper chaperone PCu(A)C [Micrococcales bacterium]|nr:copper chaperone PCu(A)C [Micrococcales bacterium]